MGNITVRKNDGETSVAAPTARQWEPGRMMREFFGWDPFREMAPFAAMPSSFAPSFEIKETKDGYLFKADVPGVKEGDLEVTTSGNRLTVSGKREAEKQEQTDTFYTYERTYGDFTRSFTLPDDAECAASNADLKDGVLTITIKKKAEMQPKKIPIGTPAKKS